MQFLTVQYTDIVSSSSWKGERRDQKQSLQPCKYAPMGCLVRMMGENLVFHEEKCIVERLKVTTEKLQVLEKQIKPLLIQAQETQSLATTVSHCAPVTFKFKHLVEGKSVPFYSHPDGYKFLLSIRCNIKPQPTASIRVHIMQGEHDDRLLWPFQGVIHFEMLNQLEDRSHKQGSAKFKERKATMRKASMRNMRVPLGQEKNEEGCGEDLVIDGKHYVSGGYVYIRIKEVTVEGLSTPWLNDRLVVVTK